MTRFPNAEVVVIEFLKEQLDPDTKVGSRIPTKGSKFVTVVRTGGSRIQRVVDEAILTVEAWGATDDEALEVMTDIRELLPMMHLAATIAPTVYRVSEASGLVNLPHPDHSSKRYTMNFSVRLRGTKSTRTLR